MSATDEGRSIGQLVSSATAELSALVHDEIALAKAEIRQDVKRGVMGGGVAAVAAVLLLFSLPVLSFAAAYGIHNLGLGLAWSFLIVGAAFILLALIMLLFAVSKFKKIKPPEKSITSAKESVSVLQKAKPHPRPVSETQVPAVRAGSAPAGPVTGESENVTRSAV